MGVMEKFRSSTKYILWILIVSFAVLWGLADTQVFDAINAGPNALGEVNGQPISFEAYNQKVESYRERYRYETGNNATEEMIAYYKEQAWDELVLDVLIKDKMDELGIVVTDQEITDMITGPNPDPFIAQQFTNENGVIDRDALNAAISAPENTSIWILIEQQLRDKRRREILSQYLAASVSVTEAEIKDEYIDRNSSVTFDYVRVPYRSIPDSLITYTDSDLKAFYKKEINRYQRKKTWNFNYVTFDLTPTKEDTTKAYSEVELAKTEFTNSDDDSLIFLQYSSVLPYKVNTVQKSELKDLYKPILKLKNGDVSEIIVDENDQLHVLKKVGQTKSEISFIDFGLNIIADPLGTVEDRLREANDFSYFSSESSFSEEAANRNYVVRSAAATKDSPYIPGLGQTLQVLNWLEAAKVGDINETPFELANAFVVVELVEVMEAGPRPFEDVKSQVERLYISEMKKEQVLNNLNAIASSSLEEIATSMDSKVEKAENVRFNASVIPGIGREPLLMGALKKLEINTISEPIAGDFGAIIAYPTEKSMDPGTTMDLTVKNQIKTELEQQRQQAINQVWVDELKEEADIKDFRSLLVRR